MRELDLNFENKQGKFSQVAKSEKAYMYHRLTGNDSYYEVFERVEQKESTAIFAGKEIHFDACVKYPSNEDFGKFAWCFGIKENAESKFNELSN